MSLAQAIIVIKKNIINLNKTYHDFVSNTLAASAALYHHILNQSHPIAVGFKTYRC